MNSSTESELTKPQQGRLAFTGASMTPFLKPKDQLVVEFFAQPGTGALQPGELALTRADGEWVAHRVVLGPDGELRMKGDHALEMDPPSGQAWGRIVGLHRGAQELSWGTRPPLGSMVAKLSLRFHHQIPRPLRWLSRIGIFGVAWTSMAALHFLRNIRRTQQAWMIFRSPHLKHSNAATVRNSAWLSLGQNELAPDERVSLDLSLARLRISRSSRTTSSRALLVGFDSNREINSLSKAFTEVKEMNFLSLSPTALGSGAETYDMVWVSRGVLNQIQGRARRVRFLKDCSKRLAPGGVMNMFPEIQSIAAGSKMWLFSSVLRLRWGGNRWEEGDTVLTAPDCSPTRNDLQYWHFYKNSESFLQEIRSAGLRTASATPPPASGPWILRRDL